MTAEQGRLTELAGRLRSRLPARGSSNLVVVVAPPAEATKVGRVLADLLQARPFDFDAEAIAAMEEKGWDTCLTLERAGMSGLLHEALAEATARVRGLVEPDRPVVVLNVNLPDTRALPGVGNELYEASTGGMVVLCVGGSVKDGRVMLHHRLSVIIGQELAEIVDLTT